MVLDLFKRGRIRRISDLLKHQGQISQQVPDSDAHILKGFDPNEHVLHGVLCLTHPRLISCSGMFYVRDVCYGSFNFGLGTIKGMALNHLETFRLINLALHLTEFHS